MRERKRTITRHSLGVFWLRAGNDRLDVLPVGGVYAGVRGVLRRRAGLDSVDDYCRAVQPGAAAERDGDRGAGQLDGELRCWNWFPKFKGEYYIPDYVEWCLGSWIKWFSEPQRSIYGAVLFK